MIKVIVNCSVDPDHIDIYNHVNNSFIPIYTEKGRIALQKKLGLSDESLFDDDLGFLVRGSKYFYKQQIKVDDNLIIESQLKPYKGGMLFFMEHKIKTPEEIAVEGETEHFFYDFNQNKPIRPPEEFIKRLRSLLIK